eukprot:CAMPEP_0172659214 /NCGR_PEP_ID=MMETSP1074-20121228/3285_1 /TAXON_ID=2916 /ORGANISM="Ceratium fusus, Strain PA161109" /LENGTH=198 /DNA_ID=CAMNT_0013474653 /DNA_START=16 /DNA_END=609 /DNA_ORIENTATION=+
MAHRGGANAPMAPMAFAAYVKGMAPQYRYGLPSQISAGSLPQAEASRFAASAARTHQQQGYFWTAVAVCAGLQRGIAANRTCARKRALKQRQSRSSISIGMSRKQPVSVCAIGATTTGPVVQTNHDAASTCEKLSGVWGMHSLTAEDLIQLERGLPVQKQQRHGGQGTGFVVFEVNAPSSVVLNSLTKLEDYTKMIPV